MVIMFSTFHTCMSFYGSISYIMTSSGNQSFLELIYAEYTVPHIFPNKSFTCATPAHLISAGVLSALFIDNVHNINFNLNIDNENLARKFQEALTG